MINGSELTTPSRKQQAYTLEFIQTIENEIAKGNDNFFMSVPVTLYLAVNWSDIEVYVRVQHLTIYKEYDIDEKHIMLHIIVQRRDGNE